MPRCTAPCRWEAAPGLLLLTSSSVSTRLLCTARLPACPPARLPACLPACPAFVLISCLSTGIDKEVSLPILTPLLLAPACDACLPPLQTELRINFSAILQKMNINPHTLGGGSRLKLLKLSKRSSS